MKQTELNSTRHAHTCRLLSEQVEVIGQLSGSLEPETAHRNACKHTHGKRNSIRVGAINEGGRVLFYTQQSSEYV